MITSVVEGGGCGGRGTSAQTLMLFSDLPLCGYPAA